MTDKLSSVAIRQGLKTRIFGQAIHHYRQIGSTNTALKQFADQGAVEGMLVVADEQVAGRGRFERAWNAPPESGLLMSLLFRPTFLPPTHAQQLTMICALAAVEAIAEQTGLRVGLKWPNDLVYEGRKLAGVLTELSFAGDRLEWAVVGVGLNVNLDFNIAPAAGDPDRPALAETATSLQTILGYPVPRLAILQTYLGHVEARYEALQAGQSPHTAWAEKLVTLGREVTISDQTMTRRGLAEAVMDDGALVVRFADGSQERILAGDVTLHSSWA